MKMVDEDEEGAWTVRRNVADVEKEFGLPPETFRRLPVEEARQVVERARATFVVGEPRAWWLGLSQPFASIGVPESATSEYLSTYWPSGEEKAYFIPECEDEGPMDVFEGTVDAIRTFLGECESFEYYLCSNSFEWLIIYNDHSDLILVGDRLVREAPSHAFYSKAARAMLGLDRDSY